MRDEGVMEKAKMTENSRNPASLELQRFTALTLPLTKSNCGVKETVAGHFLMCESETGICS